MQWKLLDNFKIIPLICSKELEENIEKYLTTEKKRRQKNNTLGPLLDLDLQIAWKYLLEWWKVKNEIIESLNIIYIKLLFTSQTPPKMETIKCHFYVLKAARHEKYCMQLPSIHSHFSQMKVNGNGSRLWNILKFIILNETISVLLDRAYCILQIFFISMKTCMTK